MPPTPSDDPRAPTAASAEPRQAATRFRFADFTFDVARRELRRGAVVVEMPVRVFECLEHLIAHRSRAVGRDELAQAVFRRIDVSDGQLAQLVLRARRCVDDDGQAQQRIRTVPRFGFRWVAETQTLAAVPPAVTPMPTAALRAAAAGRTRTFAPRVVAGLVVLLACAALVGGLLRGDDRAAPGASASIAGDAQAAVIVLPARVQGDSDSAWMRLGLMDLLAERLRRAGLAVPPSEHTLALLRGTGEHSPHAGLRRRVSVAWIVDSRISRRGNAWRVALAGEAADRTVQRASAQGPDALATARLACDRLLAAIGRAAPVDAAAAPLQLDERLQRARAAMLANQPDLARRLLDAASPTQRALPKLRFRRAQVDYRAGALASAERGLDGLVADPALRADPLLRARTLVYRGGVRMRRGALPEAERDFDAALVALQGHGGELEHGAALNGRASVRAALGRHDAAIEDFGAARLRLLRAGDPIGVARVDANLGALELERGHPAQALDYLDGALPVFVETAAVNEQQVTRSAIAAAQLQRLDARAALAAADAAARLLPRTTDPTLRLAVALDRADALIALGRLDEARRLVDDPAIAATTTPPYEQRRAQTRVDLAWHSGNAEATLAFADAALSAWPVVAGDTVRDRVVLRRSQAAERADAAPRTDLGSLPTAASVPALLAIAIGRGAAPQADADYRAALSLAEARGAPADIVEATLAYVPWLLRHGRPAEAATLVGRVSPWAARSDDVVWLQWRLARAQGDAGTAARQRTALETLAGERRRLDDADGVEDAPVRHP